MQGIGDRPGRDRAARPGTQKKASTSNRHAGLERGRLPKTGATVKEQLSIPAQLYILDLTASGECLNVDLRWRPVLPGLHVQTTESIQLLTRQTWHRVEEVLPSKSVALRRWIRILAFFLLFASFPTTRSDAQSVPGTDVKTVPLLTGSAGFISTFDDGEPHLGPIVTSIALVPIGQRWLFETRATFESDMVQLPGESGFHGKVHKEVDYAQLDFIANPYLTVTVGRFLTPFGIFNERLYPVWIRNLQTDPLILPIGIGPSNASMGAMLRGGFKAHPQFNINYVVYFSALSTVSPVDSDRFAGGRVGIFVPKARLEIGGSFQHSLQDERSNSFGFHGIWQPTALPMDLRGEYARSKMGSGYWVESAYRLSQVPFFRNELRRTQLVARMQEFFVADLPSDSLLPVNTKQFEFGLNYYFMDGLKGTSSYGRQFSTDGNKNVWTIGLTYRFVVPLGHAGSE